MSITFSLGAQSPYTHMHTYALMHAGYHHPPPLLRARQESVFICPIDWWSRRRGVPGRGGSGSGLWAASHRLHVCPLTVLLPLSCSAVVTADPSESHTHTKGWRDVTRTAALSHNVKTYKYAMTHTHMHTQLEWINTVWLHGHLSRTDVL